MNREIIYMDLFSGTGGYAKGLKNAGFVFKQHYFSEVDKFAIGNYLYNFKNAKNVGDITKIKTENISRPDILTFGSPCQDISLVGTKRGLRGKRSKLFFKAVEIIKQLRPRCFIFENVKNLLASNKGKDFKRVLQVFAEIGLYDCQWELLNSSRLLPQNRERLYLVGYIAEERTPKIFPLQIHYKKTEKIVEKGVKHIIQLGKVYKNRFSGFINCPSGLIPSLMTGTHNNGSIKTGNRFRRLTPVECERAQGFPDEWTKYARFGNEIIELSDTQRYKLIGNAVSPPIVREIGKVLLNDQNEELNGTTKNKLEMSTLNEITVTYTPAYKGIKTKIMNSESAEKIIRKVMDDEKVNFREHMIVLYLDRSNHVVGYHLHSIGGVSGTVVDPKIILGIAVKELASGIILAHNHPSGALEPSQSDITITKKVQSAAKLLDIILLDHLIITKDGYNSLADKGILGANPFELSNKGETEKVNEESEGLNSEVKQIALRTSKGQNINNEEEPNSAKPKKVEKLSPELKFAKRYLNLHGKVKTRNHIRLFLSAVQKAFVDKTISKKSAYSEEMKLIQTDLLTLMKFLSKSEVIKVHIPMKKRNRMLQILGKEDEFPSVKLIQKYIALQDKPIERNQAKKLHNLIARKINSGSLNKEDRYWKQVGEILLQLKAFYLKNPIGGRLSVGQHQLNGLQEIVSIHSSSPNNNYSTTPYKNTIINSLDLMKLKFEKLGFTGKWKKLIGNPSKGFSAMIFGYPKMGKSYLAIQWAGYLARNHGKVLFAAKEEGIDETLKSKIEKMNVAHPNLDASDHLPGDLSNYDFVFLDSVTKLELSAKDIETLEKSYPNTSFIRIHQSTKQGSFRGENDHQHDVDVVIEIPERGKAVQFGRFNQGGEIEIFEKAA